MAEADLKTSKEGGFCHGKNDEHCCWIRGRECEWLRTDVPGRRWACGLFVELGSWEAVHADERYRTSEVGQYLAEQYGAGCGDFPQRINAVMENPTAGKCCYG